MKRRRQPVKIAVCMIGFFSEKSEVGRSVRWHAHVLSLPEPIVHIIAAIGQIAGNRYGYNKCDFQSTGTGREQQADKV